jgi:hypothetical protein
VGLLRQFFEKGPHGLFSWMSEGQRFQIKLEEKMSMQSDDYRKRRSGGLETQTKNRPMRNRVPAAVAVVAGLLLSSFPGAASADEVLQWRKIVGIIQSGDTVGTGTGKTTGGGQPWYATGGSVAVDLTSGEIQFQVHGLVLAGGNAIGTPGAVTQVKGTLVCDTTGSATGNSTLVDTPLVTLSSQGDARFAGQIGPLPSACTASANIAFLIRVSGGAWIAAGEVREDAPNY